MQALTLQRGDYDKKPGLLSLMVDSWNAAAVLQSCFPQTSLTLQPTESFLADFMPGQRCFGVIHGSKLGTGVLILINWLAQKVVHFHNIAYLGRTSSDFHDMQIFNNSMICKP